jgi:hypothetical protein
MKWFDRSLIMGMVCVAVIFGGKAIGSTTTHPPTRPCPEDATWVGMGQYSHGYWSWYKCIATDDVTAWAAKHH